MRECDGPAMCHELAERELAESIGGDLPPLVPTMPLKPPPPIMPTSPLVPPPPGEGPTGAMIAAGLAPSSGQGSGLSPYAGGGPDPCL
jgi:hypothetical protein